MALCQLQPVCCLARTDGAPAPAPATAPRDACNACTQVRVVEHVTQGIENAGAAFVEMMAGGNTGKAVVRVCEKDPFPMQQQ